MLNEAILKSYDDGRQDLAGLAVLARDQIIASMRGAGIKYQAVSSRVKERASLAQKIARPDKIYDSLSDVTDVVGLRVITYFEDHIREAARLMEEHFHVDFERSIHKSAALDANEFGYRSLHYICRFRDPSALQLPPGLAEFPFEVQICSVLQHAWAEVEHDLGYKYEVDVPRHIRRKFSRLAGVLEMVDEEFVSIRDYLTSYQKRVSAEIEGGAESVSLDSVSLAAFVRSDVVKTKDSELAQRLSLESGDQLFFLDYMVKIFHYLGVRSIGDLQGQFAAHKEQVAGFSDRYFAFTREIWGFDADNMDRLQGGYSVFLLGHMLVLERKELQLEKIDEVAAFFETLDYPEDPAEARRVAEAFVRHLG